MYQFLKVWFLGNELNWEWKDNLKKGRYNEDTL